MDFHSLSDRLVDYLVGLGPLRWVLLGTTLVFAALAPAPGTSPVYEGWAVVPTLLAPVMAPLIVFVVALDTLMARVLMVDKEGPERRRLRGVLVTNIAVAAICIAAWTPYFRGLAA